MSTFLELSYLTIKTQSELILERNLGSVDAGCDNVLTGETNELYNGCFIISHHFVFPPIVCLEKLLVCLDIFADVGLLQIRRQRNYMTIELAPAGEKADLAVSRTMQRLQGVKESG